MSNNRAGEQHLRAGTAALKTSIWSFKFKPNYDVAATEFNEAARCFAERALYSESVTAQISAATALQSNRDSFGAARAWEAAASSSINFLNNPEKGCTLLENAAECYQLVGKPDSAGRVYLKVAELCEKKLEDLPRASAAFKHAIDVHEAGDKEHNVLDILKDYVSFLARYVESPDSVFLTELVEALEKQFQLHVKLSQLSSAYKIILSLVILQLYKNSPIGASNQLDNSAITCPSFLSSRESDTANRLISAWNDGAPDKFSKLMKSSVVTYLPVPIVKLGRQLSPPTFNNTLRSDTDKHSYEGEESGLHSATESDDVASLLM